MQPLNIRHQIRKPLPLDMHVILQRLLRSSGVAGFDGGDDGFVFSVGAVHAVADMELQAAVRLEDGVQARGFFGEEGVVAGAVETVMKEAVLVVVTIGVVGFQAFTAGGVGVLEFRKLLRGDASRGESTAHGFQFCHDFKAFHQLRNPQLGHEGAALGHHLHHAGGGQLLQRLADRRA